tara:strand:- start:350 stop:478 length:129 start_codon:yes stop_codon:yes gene_type:complete
MCLNSASVFLPDRVLQIEDVRVGVINGNLLKKGERALPLRFF